MLEGAGHAVDLGRATADRLGCIAPGRGHGPDSFDSRARLRQREREKLRRRLQQIERTGALVEIDVRGQHPRLEIGRNRIEVVCRRERPTRLSQPQETVIAEVVVEIGNQHIEDDTPVEGVGVRLPLGAMLREGVDDLRVAAPLAVPSRPSSPSPTGTGFGSHHHGRSVATA